MFVTGPKVVEVCQFNMTERNHMSYRELTFLMEIVYTSVDFLISRK